MSLESVFHFSLYIRKCINRGLSETSSNMSQEEKGVCPVPTGQVLYSVPHFYVSYVYSGTSENVFGELCNEGLVWPFEVVMPCPTFCLWNKATEALKQVRFILLCSAYDKLLWHHGTATGQCHRITAARGIPSIFLSLCFHLNRLALH